MLRVGIDVGGTNTDAALLEGDRIVATTKSPTTEDVVSGIVTALAGVTRTSLVDPSEIDAVMIGTTHFVNAVVQRKGLLRAGVVRLAAPATRGLPPFTGWPHDLRSVVGGHVCIAAGGVNFDGSPISPLDEVELRRTAAHFRAAGLTSVAVTGVFSPVDPEMERTAGNVFADEIPGCYITRGAEVGRIGMLERENAAILNASLRGIAEHVVSSFEQAIVDAGLSAELFISQNDGTLMTSDWALEYPVLTFSSGPTNSMRGAAALSGVDDAIVVDIGGTTSDVGILKNGFPREAAAEVEVGGVKTNFRMPDVFSIGLGGGTIVRVNDGRLSVGPESVGHLLTRDALVFGGETMTTTDIAVASGIAELGDPRRVAHLDAGLVRDAQDMIKAMLEDAVDRIKTERGDVPVVLVGGGSILVSGDLRGSSDVVRPPHGGAANAVGAAIGQVGGEIDHIVSFTEDTRDEVLNESSHEATRRAVAAGAGKESVQIVDVEVVPMSYMGDVQVGRVRVRAVGDLVTGSSGRGGGQ